MNHWKLTILLGVLIFVSALSGGYFGHFFNVRGLKGIFAVVMLLPPY